MDSALNENEIAKQILDAAFLVHTKLGPGVFESADEVLLAHKLQSGLKRVINGQLDGGQVSDITL